MAAEKIVTESALTALASDAKRAIYDVLPSGSASGNPCTFDTDIAVPLKSLIANIVSSGGNGTPSTPIPIVGHSELNLVRCGKNLYDKSTYPFEQYSIYNPTVCWSGSFYLPANTYTHNCSTGFGTCFINVYPTKADADANTNRISQTSFVDGGSKTETYSTGVWLRVQQNNTGGTQTDYDKVSDAWQIKLGSEASAYEPFNGTPYLVSFGQTVYGGVYDANAGKVDNTYSQKVNLADLSWNYQGQNCFYATVTGAKTGGVVKSNHYVYTDILIGSSRPNNSISLAAYYGDSTISIKDENYSDVPSFVASLTGADAIYELATPIEIDVSELSVDTLVGTNNIISDCGGDVEVEYRESVEKYVNDHSATRTDVVGTLTAGQTSITLSSTAITTSSTIEVFTDPEVPYNSLTVTSGQTVLTFDAQANNVSVKVRVT